MRSTSVCTQARSVALLSKMVHPPCDNVSSFFRLLLLPTRVMPHLGVSALDPAFADDSAISHERTSQCQESSSTERPCRMASNAAGLPTTHNDFVDGVVAVVQEALGNDKLSEKTKTRLEDSRKTNATVLGMRFALGKDDNAYMQMGMSLLDVGATGKSLPLAPNALYSADVLDAIRKGVENAQRKEYAVMAKRKDSELTWVAETLLKTLLSEAFTDVMTTYLDTFDEKDGFPQVVKIINNERDAKQLAQLPRFKDLLYALLAVVERDAALATKISNQMLADRFTDEQTGQGELLEKLNSQISVHDLLGAMKSGERTGAVASEDNDFFEYALRRGLFATRAPHERALEGHPSDSVLQYRVPAEAAAAHRDIDVNELPLETGSVVDTVPRADRRTVQRAFSALNGNFAMDECADGDRPCDSGVVLAKAKQLRWLPAGAHARDLTNLAVWEHAAARCAHVAATNTDLSKEVKSLLLGTALRFKYMQLEPFYQLSCTWQRDGAPPLGTAGTTLIAPPTASINGTLAHPRGMLVATLDDVSSADDHDRLTHQAIAATARMSASSGLQTYSPPIALCENFAPVPTGAGVARPTLPMRPDGTVDPRDLQLQVYRRLILYGLKYATLTERMDRDELERERDAAIDARPLTSKTPGAAGSVEDRRSGLWNELKRELAISSDRVWTFVQTLSGLIGESADSLITAADESAMRAAQEMERQRRAISERVTQFHTKLVETIVSGIISGSKLQVTTSGAGRDAAESLVVVDADTAKQIKDLASGESGRPFFEANVALRTLTDSVQSQPKTLANTVSAFTDVVSTLHDSLNRELQRPETAGASLEELASPSNSYFIRLRNDTAASIRSAFDRFSTEFRLRGGSRHIYLWELVEGNDHQLSSRFADFVGHALIQNRVSTGVTAMYASRTQLVLNASQAEVSLGKLINQASMYARYTPKPNFEAHINGRIQYFQNARESEETGWASAGPTALRLGSVPMLINRGGWSRGLVY
jgi:hypothetical protein